MFNFVKLLLQFIVAVVESSVKVVYPLFHQTLAGGFDDLDGLLCVHRRLKFGPELDPGLCSGG